MPKPPSRIDKYNEDQKKMKNTLAERLKKCRTDRNLSHEKLAEELGKNFNIDISKQALINYEKQEEYDVKYKAGFGMNITYLWAFAGYFEVSAQYLLGLSDEPNPIEDIRSAALLTGLSGEAISVLIRMKDEPSLKPSDDLKDKCCSPNDMFSMMICHDYFFRWMCENLNYYIECKDGYGNIDRFINKSKSDLAKAEKACSVIGAAVAHPQKAIESQGESAVTWYKYIIDDICGSDDVLDVLFEILKKGNGGGQQWRT